MIMKENKQIGFIYKNNENIDKIIKNGEVVFERGFLRERTSTTLPITFGGVGKDLKDYRVYGNTYQNSTSGINEWNSFNKEQTDNYKVLEDGTIQLINSSSSSNGYTRMNKTLKEMCPNLNVGDTVYLYIESTWYRKEIYSSSLGASGAWQNGRSRTLTQQMLDDYIILYGGYQTTSTIKIMITKNQYYDTYEPYTGGQPSPNPNYPQEIISCGDNETGLPFGYTKVDYIHATNNSYIDTGYKPNSNTNIKMKITISNGTARPFGVLEGNVGYLNSVGYWRIFSTSGQKKEPRGTYDYEIQGNKVYIDGEIIYTGGTPISFNYNLYLFASNVDGTVNYGTNGYLYYFKIYDNNVLVRDFIPCYRNSDNEVGLYDLVNNVFYTNQGTGVFTYGSEIEKGGYKIPISINGNITNIYLNEPLRKIGDYADYIDFINGKVVRQIGEVVLNGSEDWTTIQAYGRKYYAVTISNLLISNSGSNDALLYNNYYIGYKSNELVGNNTKDYGISRRNNNSQVLFRDKDQSILSDLTTWLSTHNSIMCYPLATPTEESITLPNIPTVDGNNTLNIETELTPSQVYIKYKSNT